MNLIVDDIVTLALEEFLLRAHDRYIEAACDTLISFTTIIQIKIVSNLIYYVVENLSNLPERLLDLLCLKLLRIFNTLYPLRLVLQIHISLLNISHISLS